MKLKVRDKSKFGDGAPASGKIQSLKRTFDMGSSGKLSVVLQLMLIVLVSVPISYSTDLEYVHAREKQPDSYTRVKRQIFRQSIPADRPLSGNAYAEHHGFPHPGRWHERPQSIKPANPNSGHHFSNENLILTDEDFNRYGSTLQHIDEMIYQQRLREQPQLQQQYQEPPQQLQLNLLQNHPPAPQQHHPHLQVQIPSDYAPPPAPVPAVSYGPPSAPPPSVSYGPLANSIQYLPPPPPQHPPPPPQPFQPSYFPPPHPHQQQHPPQHNFLSNHPGIEHGQIHVVSDNNVHGHHPSGPGPAPLPPSESYGPTAPETEIVHHGSPNPAVPVVAHFHYTHQLGEVKGQRTVKYLPGSHVAQGHSGPSAPSPQYGAELGSQYGLPPAPRPSPQYGVDLRPQYGPVPVTVPQPSPQYGAELNLPQYDVLGPDDDIHSARPGPTFYGPPPAPAPVHKHTPKPVNIHHQHHHHHQGPSFNRLKGPSSYSVRRPKHFSSSSSYGGYLPARRPVRYSLRTPGSYSWSVSY